MFQKGEYVACGNNGICKVTDISTLNMASAPKGRLYYVLKPVYAEASTVYIPVDNHKAALRAALTKTDVHELIKKIPDLDLVWVENDKQRELTYKEYLKENHKNLELIPELEKQELEYLENAFKGFVEARQSESFPMCGMDETTVDYLLAVLATRFKKFDVATKLVSDLLTNSSVNNRVKDKARELKEQILEELRKK